MKIRCSLSADQGEVDQLGVMLDTCPTGGGGGSPTTTTTTAPRRLRGWGFGAMQCDAPGSPDDASNINQEWVQVMNRGPNPAALGAWTVSDAADNTYTIPAGFTPGRRSRRHPPQRAGHQHPNRSVLGPHPARLEQQRRYCLLRNTSGTQVASKTC